MAYYAALVSVVQLLKEINNPQHPYPNSLLPKKHQIYESLYGKFKVVQELLENYSRKDHKEESVDILEGRIRDAAYRAQDIIESQISNHIPQSKRKRRADVILVQKMMEEVDLIVEELRRITPESHEAHKDDLQQKNTNSSEDCSLVPLVQLLEEICHQDQYPNSLLDKGQIASLHGNFKILQQVMQKEEPAGHVERRIRDAADRTHDIIKTHISNKIHGDLSLNILAKEYQDLNKVKEEVGSILEGIMRIKMEKVSIHGDNEQGTNYSASSGGASMQAPSMDGVGGASKAQDRSFRSTPVVLDEDLITTIKGQICRESSRLEVIAIVGMGGLGKTTLARTIFDAKLVEERFDCRAWVTISQDYHLRNILVAIIDSLNKKNRESGEVEENVLVEHVYKHLFGRRYLIILDDIWDAKAWKDIRKIFPDNSNGSRIMITTRVSGVAVDAGCSLKFLHQIRFLNEEQSWDLLRQKVFAQEHCPGELEVVGKLIAKNCRGLPLAIVAVAGILSNVSKAQHHWENIAKNISLIAIDQNNEHLSRILSLSYNHLPHHLKPCFLYLGGFPEDHKIRISKLIRLWVAEGFLIPTESKSLEEVGRGYLEDLVNRNLVLISKKLWQFHDKISYCYIHDLLRELCLQKARSENFFLSLHQKDLFCREPVSNVRRVYIQTCDGSFFLPNHVSHVRSVISFVGAHDHYFSSVVSDSKLLRILDTSSDEQLQQNDFDESSGILNLLHLRYLEFCAIEIKFPPSLFKLQNLQSLIVHDGEISLPSEIWKMPQLRHVIGESVALPPIPYDEIKNADGVPLLGMLQTLSKVEEFRFTRDTVDMIPNLKKLESICSDFMYGNVWEGFGLNNLVHLLQLESLVIQCSIDLCHIVSLTKTFAFPSTLIKLTLDGCNLPWKDMTVVGSLPSLQKLKLAYNAFVGEEWKPIEGEFPKLKFLQMEYLFDLKYWHAENTHFPCLEGLYIEECKKLEEIPPGFVDIPTLQYIEVYECSSGLGSSALEIQQAQRDEGNDDFHVVLSEIGIQKKVKRQHTNWKQLNKKINLEKALRMLEKASELV